MKFRVTLVTLVVAGLAASLAVTATATPPKQQTQTDTTAATTTPGAKQRVCRARFALVLQGTLVSVADDQQSFTIAVKQSNKHARAYRGLTLTVQVDANTKIWRQGSKVTLGGLTLGDRLVVRTRACKPGTDPTAPLLAARVVARPAQPARVCRARFALILHGPLASVAAGQQSFTVTVKQSNRHARAYRGMTLTVQVDANTKILRQGQKVTLGDLTLGDRLVVQTRACKPGTDPSAPLLAARVVARPAQPAPTTTTTTTTS